MVRQLSFSIHAFRGSEHEALAELQDFRLAKKIFFPRATQEIGFHLRRNGYLGGSQLCHDGQPHGHVSGEHEDLSADDPAWPLEMRKIRDGEGAGAVARRGHDEAVRSGESALPIDELLELLDGDRGGMLARELLALSSKLLGCVSLRRRFSGTRHSG